MDVVRIVRRGASPRPAATWHRRVDLGQGRASGLIDRAGAVIMADVLRFRRVATGEQEEIPARVDDVEFPAGEFLTARTVWLEDGTPSGLELSQHRPVSGDRRPESY